MKSALFSLFVTVGACQNNGEDTEPTPTTYTALSEPTIYDIAYENHDVPFGNGTGVHLSETGEVLFAYTLNHRLNLGYTDGTTVPVTTQQTEFSFGTALGAEHDFVAVVTTQPTTRQMRAQASQDFGVSFDPPTDVGDAGVGATVPSVCAWQEGNTYRALVAWVAPPVSGDGGPMYVASYDGAQWSQGVRVGSSDVLSAPTLSCEAGRQELVARNEIGNGNIEVHRYERDTMGGWNSGEVIIAAGADPHYCVAGDDQWVGYHNLGSAYLAHSSDGGGTWAHREVDSSGKFTPITCAEGGLAAVCRGDWDTKAEAESRDPGRRISCSVTFDGGQTYTEFAPVGAEEGQGVTSMSMTTEGLAIFWGATNGIRLALYDFL